MFQKSLIAFILMIHLSLVAEVSQGETLERQMWDYIKKRDWNEMGKRIAPYFQLVGLNKIRNREETLNQLKYLNANVFSLSNFKVTEGPGVFIVTYDAAVSEVLENDRFYSNASRISVWQNNNGNWQWAAHGILIPLAEIQK